MPTPRTHFGILLWHPSPSLTPGHPVELPRMNWLIHLIFTFLEVLRRLGHRITSRRPIPIPVRSRPVSTTHSPFSLTLTDLRSPTGTRRGMHW